MNRRVVAALLLIAVVLVAGGATIIQADSARQITGGYFSMDFFGVEQGWFNLQVRELDRTSGDAYGSVHWKEYIEALGWRRVQAHPVCVAFDEFQGQSSATFVVRVDRIRGWRDPAEFEGELLKFWVVDGGTPGSAGDLWSSVGPWPPTADLGDYGCGYEEPEGPFQPLFPVHGGNLTIHD